MGLSLPVNLLYDGVAVLHSSVFKFLGMLFHESHWISHAPRSLATKAAKALWALMDRMKILQISCLDV